MIWDWMRGEGRVVLCPPYSNAQTCGILAPQLRASQKVSVVALIGGPVFFTNQSTSYNLLEKNNGVVIVSACWPLNSNFRLKGG